MQKETIEIIGVPDKPNCDYLFTDNQVDDITSTIGWIAFFYFVFKYM